MSVGFAHPRPQVGLLVKTLLHAILSLIFHNSPTLLILPLYSTRPQKESEKLRQYNALLRHPKLQPLALWKTQTFPLMKKEIQGTIEIKTSHQTLLAITSHYFPNKETLTLKEQLNDLSMIYAADNPIFFENKNQSPSRYQQDIDELLNEYKPKYMALPTQQLQIRRSKRNHLQESVSKLDLASTLHTADISCEQQKKIFNLISHLTMHIPSAKRQCRENIISTSILEKIKKENIPNAVRMVHDKNPGEITEECPYRYYLRLQNELFDISTNDTKKLKGKSFLKINNL